MIRIGRLLPFIRSFRSYGLNRLDRKLAKHLPRGRGFFVELGANNGIAQSNTLYLERYRAWNGILIEAVPSLAARCAENRPTAWTYNCACTDEAGMKQRTLRVTDCNLMSVVEGAFGDPNTVKRWVDRGLALQGLTESTSVSAPCRTLSSILEERGDPHVDLLSIDVEGYEMRVLRGLDLRRHRPAYILVEVLITPLQHIQEYLDSFYSIVGHLSEGDVLFRLR
jgi:FkbM family methyltransferase